MQRTPKNYNGTSRTTKELKYVLGAVLKNVRKKQAVNPVEVLSSWEGIVGPQLAQMTTAVRFDEGVLFILVKNSTLLSILNQHEKPQILNKLRSRFPNIEIKNIIFRMG